MAMYTIHGVIILNWGDDEIQTLLAMLSAGWFTEEVLNNAGFTGQGRSVLGDLLNWTRLNCDTPSPTSLHIFIVGELPALWRSLFLTQELYVW
jgi:hypothetical protein